MDVLKDKQTKTYEYLSRYAQFPFYYHTLDNKFIYGLTNNLAKDITSVKHIIKQGDTLDSLSLKYYGRPDYYWVIADFNRIQDPFIVLYGNYAYLNIPTLTEIKYIGENL